MKKVQLDIDGGPVQQTMSVFTAYVNQNCIMKNLTRLKAWLPRLKPHLSGKEIRLKRYVTPRQSRFPSCWPPTDSQHSGLLSAVVTSRLSQPPPPLRPAIRQPSTEPHYLSGFKLPIRPLSLPQVPLASWSGPLLSNQEETPVPTLFIATFVWSTKNN